MIVVEEFRGRTVAVFGLARSGLATVRALLAGGARVAAWDDGEASRTAAAAQGIPLVDLSTADWSRFAALVLAPGVPLHFPEPHWTVQAARAAGVPVIGDVELFARTLSAMPETVRPKVVAITGTNGKSTTTALIHHILRAVGRDARIGGNIGRGVLDLDPPRPGAIYVLELSSYQLDLTTSLRANVAVHLNLTPDHLDRHGTMENYAAAKARIFAGQTPADAAVVGVDDDWGLALCTRLHAQGRGRVIAVSAGMTPGGRAVYAIGARLYDAIDPRATVAADLADAPALRGAHNAQNAAAAFAAVRALGVPARQAAEALLTFPGLAHRLERVGAVGRVLFVNDSKATNADAAARALASYPRVHWIAGGVAKDGGIAPLGALFGRVARAYLIGAAADDFAATLDGKAPYAICGDLETAVAAAYADAQASGEAEPVVLLAPACASFDQFRDFEARGDAFRALVRDLGARQGAPAEEAMA